MKHDQGSAAALPALFVRRFLAKSGANSKPSRHNDELRQWATAIVKKATPKIVKSLIEAAESLEKPMQMPKDKPASHPPEEPQDESLAALLLRLLHAGENGGTDNGAATARTTVSENPSLG